MTVFKNYFKIVKKYLPLIIIYTVVFGGFAILSSSSNNQSSTFTATKPKITIINNDNSSLSKTFTTYIKNYVDIKDLKNNNEADALFYREVDAIITIPENFTVNFENKLDLKTVPDSSSTVILNQYINSFFQTAEIYLKSGLSEEDINERILSDLNIQTDVSFLTKTQEKINTASSFFNFLSYILLALAISIIGIIMSSFLDKNIKKRNLISAYSYRKINQQLFLGNAVYIFALWLLYMIISIVLYKEVMFSVPGLILGLNTFIFMIVCLALGFLIGSLIKNKEAQNGISNIVALGSAFISGAFVPQEYLGAFVLGIARITPAYWFIKNNNDIALLSNFDFNSLKPILMNMGVMLLFALFFFFLTNIISHFMREQN